MLRAGRLVEASAYMMARSGQVRSGVQLVQAVHATIVYRLNRLYRLYRLEAYEEGC